MLTKHESPIQTVPGTPQPAPLPKCLTCKTNEVKPGEDQCWECLGEVQEPEQPEWITGSGMFFGTTTFNAASIPLSINGLDIYGEILKLQAQVKALAEDGLHPAKPWWRRLWDWKL